MNRWSILTTALVMLVGSSLAEAQLMKRIAVARFEDRSGSGWSNVGEGVSDMLVTALVKTGKFQVMERSDLDKVIAEQQLGESGVLTPETAPKAGKILGVEMIVVGSVSEFGVSEREISGGIANIGGGVTRKVARAAVDLRLVNTTTGEIVAAETEDGTESTLGFGGNYEDINFSDVSTWNTTDVGKACREAVDKCTDLISEKAPSIPWSGKILKVNGDGTVIIKPGSKAGVRTGDEFDVFRAGEEIKDPDTGLSLGSEETKIGSISVTGDMLNGQASKARVVSGTLQTGDIVRQR